jgi:hypothetical protein
MTDPAADPALQPQPDVLAIVGSVRFADPDWREKATDIIDEELFRFPDPPDLVVSGGAEGIDSLADNLCAYHGIAFKEFPPKHRHWEPEGFKARNILVAETCTRLLRVSCHGSTTYGSGWTADYAEKLGKRVRRVVL